MNYVTKLDSEDRMKIHDQQCNRRRAEPVMEMKNVNSEDTEEKPVICESCYLVFDSKESYQDHKLMCSKGKPIGRVEVENHMKLESDNNELHVCGVCQMIFSSEDLWRNHSVSCSENKPFVCEVCHLGFIEEDQIIQHKEEHCRNHALIGKSHNIIKCEPKDDDEHKCESFTHKSVQSSDKLTLSGKKSHQCGVCGKIFRKEYNLDQHIRIHTGEKPYQCDQCNKTYTQKSNLNAHKKTHSDRKPHKCDYCEKTFLDRRQMVRHARIHTGEKLYHCDVCDKAFIQKSILQRHYMIHTGRRPFQCDQCGKSFVRRSDLNMHLLTHSGERPHQCNQCDKAFYP